MPKKIFCLILILKLAQAHYSFVPKFYGQDSAIIVDTVKTVTQNKNVGFNFSNKIRIPPPFPLWRYYPRYRIIPPPPPGQILSINTWAQAAKPKPITTSTTTAATSTTTEIPPISSSTTTSFPRLPDDEFPPELLDIAQNILGLKSIDEIPSISEFGQLLGTKNSEETLKYIRKLTSNKKGIALMKAYIESADYTDSTGNSNSENNDLENDIEELEEKEDGSGDIEEPLKVNDDSLVVIADDDSNDDYEFNYEKEQMEDDNSKNILKQSKNSKEVQNVKELPQNKPSFMERIANYIHLNNLFHKSDDNANDEYNQLNRIRENGLKVSNKEENQPKKFQKNQTESEITNDLDSKIINSKTPILIRESIPYNYPVPIRVQTSTSPPLTNIPAVHLNTPKILIPHVQQLSRVTKIPSKQIEDFLASKPKLLELATKVSHFPIAYDRNPSIGAQVMAAVKRAFEQDEDLKKFITSSATLK